MEVLSRVSILRIVAAAHVTAGFAKTQMNPPVAHPQTLFNSRSAFSE
jgi:hypothetical protein